MTPGEPDDGQIGRPATTAGEADDGRIVAIDDPDDERLGDYRHLTDAALRRELERSGSPGDPGICIAESKLVVGTVLESGHRVRSVLLTPSTLAALGDVLRRFPGPVYVAGQQVMSQVAGFAVHRGALAAVERPPLPEPRELLAGRRPVAVLEGVTDHENLGVIFRAAAAFGIGGVLLSPTSADPLYRRSLRVSMGHALRVPFTRLAPWPGSLDHVRAAGFTVVALTPDRHAEPIASLDPSSLGPAALVLGSEGEGLTVPAAACADRLVRIPMAPGVDSLNVATAAAIAFHHFATIAG